MKSLIATLLLLTSTASADTLTVKCRGTGTRTVMLTNVPSADCRERAEADNRTRPDRRSAPDAQVCWSVCEAPR